MSDGPKLGEKKKIQLPHIYVLLFIIIVLCGILTWIVPAGQFDRVVNDAGREIAVAGTWHTVDATPVNPFQMFCAIYDGLFNAADIVLLVFLTYASTTFIIKSGAFDGLVAAMMKVFKGNSSLITIPVFMALLGAGSSTVGMFEEWLAFIPVFAAIYIGMGFDAVVGLAVVALGAGIGFAGATMNPFTVGVAQGIAEVTYMSGAGYRLFCHAVLLIIGAGMTMRYAAKVKADPTKSYVYGDDFSSLVNKADEGIDAEFGPRQIIVLLDLVGAIIFVIVGTTQWGWWFPQICGTFVIMGVIAAVVMKMGLNEIGQQFEVGFRDAAVAAMMVGLARGILMVLQAGNISDTIVYGLSIPLASFPPAVCAIAMLLLQTLLNFFVPSGSGQAAVSMPIMAPLADMLGVTRNTAVLAYQFGDGFSNIVWPTAFAAVMSGLAKVRLDKWWKFILPVFGIVLVVQAILLIIAVMTNFGA